MDLLVRMLSEYGVQSVLIGKESGFCVCGGRRFCMETTHVDGSNTIVSTVYVCSKCSFVYTGDVSLDSWRRRNCHECLRRNTCSLCTYIFAHSKGIPVTDSMSFVWGRINVGKGCPIFVHDPVFIKEEENANKCLALDCLVEYLDSIAGANFRFTLSYIPESAEWLCNVIHNGRSLASNRSESILDAVDGAKTAWVSTLSYMS